MAGSDLRHFYELPKTPLRAGDHLARLQARLLAERVIESSVIVDVGCGDGAIGAVVSQACPRSKVIGVDWSELALARAAREGLAPLRAALEQPGLPLRSASVDAVLMSEVIEHLVDPDQALDEAVRVLVPGGTLVLSTPNLAAWYNRLLLLVGIQPLFSEVSLRGIYGRPGQQVVGHLRLFTRRALVGLLSAHRFENITIYAARYHDVPRLLRPLDAMACATPSLGSLLVARATRPKL